MLNRRQVLAGLTAFPSLNTVFGSGSVNPTKLSKVKAHKKLLIASVGLGFFDDFFLAKKKGVLESSPLLALLKEHFNDLSVFQKITQPEIGPGHSRIRGLLTCNRNQTNGPYISLDQFIAERTLQQSRYKSFNMGNQSLVWDKNSRSMPTHFEHDPLKIYQKLFSKLSSDQAIEHEIAINNNLYRLLQYSKNSSVQDAAHYTKALNELKMELNTNLEWSRKPIPKVKFETDLHLSDAHNRGYTKPFEQHLQLANLALQNQRTQIAVVSPPYIDKTSTLNVSSSYHAAGHNCRHDKMANKDLFSIEQYLIEDFGNLLTNMKKADELDDTIVLLLGSFNDAGSHRRDHIPCLVAGGGFKHQGLVDCEVKSKGRSGMTLSQLYVSILHQIGIDVDEFAGFKGNLDHVFS